MSKKLATTEQTIAVSNEAPDSLIAQAIKAGASVETMERLFALHERVEDRKAKGAYVEALAKFQNECPEIKKTRLVKNKKGEDRYRFAPLDDVVKQIKDPLKKNYLAYTWTSSSGEKLIEVTCTLTHKQGHSEISAFAVPIDTNEYMSSPQRYASALTYAKRYSLLGVLGIATAEEDTDATTQDKEKKPVSDKAKIMFNLKQLDVATDDKTIIEEQVKKLTGLKLVEKNYSEIVSRLETLVTEKQEYETESEDS